MIKFEWNATKAAANQKKHGVSFEEAQSVFINILRRAMEAPLRQIVTNAGEEASVIVNKVKEGTGNYGYNAASGEFGDMLAMGILDPAKVARSALEHAGSVSTKKRYAF